MERWRPVEGFKGLYEISDRGRVRNTRTGRIRKNSILPRGYHFVNLGHNEHHYVHRLVAAAFIGPCPPKHEVNHRDGKKGNNHASNLEYLTHSENQQHAYRVLKTLKLNLPVRRGARNPAAKLTARKVRKIRSLIRRGVVHHEISRRFGINVATVSYIRTGKLWSHLR